MGLGLGCEQQGVGSILRGRVLKLSFRGHVLMRLSSHMYVVIVLEFGL